MANAPGDLSSDEKIVACIPYPAPPWDALFHRGVLAIG